MFISFGFPDSETTVSGHGTVATAIPRAKWARPRKKSKHSLIFPLLPRGGIEGGLQNAAVRSLFWLLPGPGERKRDENLGIREHRPRFDHGFSRAVCRFY